MTIPVIAIMSPRDRVGQTSLVYHLSWMTAELGHRVVAVDLDPLSRLSEMFLDEERLEELWSKSGDSLTVAGAMWPLRDGASDIAVPHIETIEERLGLLVGDMALSALEDELSNAWQGCLEGNAHAFLLMSALWRVMQRAAESHEAEYIVVDVGPGLGALNRAALLSSDYLIIPVMPDLSSVQGLQIVGPKLREWRQDWQERLARCPASTLSLPRGRSEPLGYMAMLFRTWQGHTARSARRWLDRISDSYREFVLDEKEPSSGSIESDPNCIARVRNYPGLSLMVQEARKPMFFLKPADGALGAYARLVQDTYRDFKKMTEAILDRVMTR